MPFIGGVPLNVNGWSDLGNGGFSAQSDALLHNLYGASAAVLSVRAGREEYARRGALRRVDPCRELTFSALPDAVQQQAQLMLAGRSVPAGPTAMSADNLTKGNDVNKCLFILLCLSLWTGQTLAGAPAGRSTSAGISFDRMAAPARFDIWLHESGGYDAADPQKWGRNTLTCQSRTDTTYGACMTAPVWFSANPAAPYAITLRFTHALTRKTVDIKVYGDHYMFINNKVFTFASFVTGGTSDLAAGTENRTSILYRKRRTG